jgi:hypothetical protein
MRNPLSSEHLFDPFHEQTVTDHSGARWMVAIALCLVMLGLACTF